ncbi:MAG TPA: glycosyltransferase family 39 protein [Anaerolineales bacterium]|nr:glycosyltransferase family 39 protein [Anaerolineales bacterium]
MNTPHRQPPLDEPSVLDYLKSLFRGGRVQIPGFAEEEKSSTANDQPERLQPPVSDLDSLLAADSDPLSTTVSLQPPETKVEPPSPFPWSSLFALFLALAGQWLLEPPPDTQLGVTLFVAALFTLGWGLYRGEWTLAPLAETSDRTDPLTYRPVMLILSLGLGLWAFTLLDENLFTTLNVTVWALAVLAFIGALWIRTPGSQNWLAQIAGFFKRDTWTITISRWTILLLAVTALAFFFRFTQTETVPAEPFSDHAEKLYDVYDVSQGDTRIFFPRNTGREAIQMYWTLWVANIFGTGLSYLSLKLGTAILGFLTLPFIYLLGKEIGGTRVALFAFMLAGIAYWPNVISRIGLRFPLYPLFVAPTLLFLLRGLRTRNRNDFLLSGLFLGLGLHGYSPFRIVPFVVIAAFILYWIHSQSKGARRELPVWLAILAITSLLVFLPLLRFWIDNPEAFGFRAFSRLSTVEQPLPGPAPVIFASNVGKALMMYNLDDGEIWVNSIPHRPALDVVTGALFLLGFVLVLIRYFRKRHWQDLFLLVSIPLLQLPSTLSLAFPGENPALNRAGAASIPAFLLAALALDSLVTSLKGRGMRNVLAWGLAGILLTASASQNYNLVFDTFANSFRLGSWNTSDMGRVIREFEQTYGMTKTVWVVPFPYWVDTRLPAAWAGIPNRDMALWPENFASTLALNGPKLFILKANTEDPTVNDQQSVDALKALYPNGALRLFDSDISGHDFWIFFVPGN